ncbi:MULTISPECIES: hypothetical protein [Bacillus cereus group]|uniref:Lipoprotein n=1 Tax=Bacillus thuringiensis TaxID=1428 RepID=A0A9X6WH20_BACTU|nr:MULTISPECIES: hypothetical protein [Bacillus cereus group]PFJ28957.1 hypothetical protein COJ15_32325 [Bacillus thuringiensis]PGP14559.1 hypothetical protein COA01_29800 [Bacillus cereus]
MGKIFINFIVMISVLLTGCSNDGVKVKVNGESKIISKSALGLVSLKNRLPVKSSVPATEIADIKIEHNGILHEVFIVGGSAIVYFNDGDTKQYEISLGELQKIQEEIKR